MKNKLKHLLIYSLACIGFMSLLLSSSEIQNNETVTENIYHTAEECTVHFPSPLSSTLQRKR